MGRVLTVLLATLIASLILAVPAQAHVRRVSMRRATSAIVLYAEHAGVRPGTVSDCRRAGRHRRMVECLVSIPMGPPGALAQATICAHHILGYGQRIFLDRIGGWQYTIPTSP